MAVFNFYDAKNKVNIPCASLSAGYQFYFSRTGMFDHQLSDEIYFKKTEMKNEANQFVYDKWYQATDFECHDYNIGVKNWIEKTPFKEDSSMKNVFQVIGNYNTLSGNTINLGDMQVEVFLKGLEASLEANPNIPEVAKKTLLSKIKDFANNPYISGLLVNSIFKYITE